MDRAGHWIRPQTGRSALRVAFQCVAIVLALFVARQPTSFWVPSPDADHVTPASFGHHGHAVVRSRVSSRTAPSPLVKRIPTLPALPRAEAFERSFALAKAEAPRTPRSDVPPFRILRRIPRMDSDEPPRG